MKTLLAALLLTSSFVHAAQFVVEAKKELSNKELNSIKGARVTSFGFKKNALFSHHYIVTGEVKASDLSKVAWIKNVEAGFEVNRLSLLPAENPVRLVGDELFPYQWGLMNQGQTFFREKDDIHNLPMVGVQEKDIAWKGLLSVLPKERPIVAVLDSGVDIEHPELVNNLWKNINECGKDPKVDNDGNKLAGDCNGWNFTEEASSDAAKDPRDNDGHGTHVAGIVAAAQNDYGTVGVNPNALILPIKVMKDSGSKSQVQSSVSFALGIMYATDMGADVINMSLGWPKSMDTAYLRKAVKYALDQGVIIVAAGGNNNSSEPLYPCGYEGVICTAASTLNGGYAGFTNFGSQIDTVAPGEGILSLFPTQFEPEFFSVPGFEVKSGTSQAAPMVAGLISVLKAQDRKMKIDEVLGRLYAAPKTKDAKKYIMGGEATWNNINHEIQTPVVRPILKGLWGQNSVILLRQLMATVENAEGRMVFPFKNYGAASGPIQVSFESLSPGIQVVTGVQEIPKLDKFEAKTLPVVLKITDFTAEATLRLKITVTNDEGTNSYLTEVPVVRDFMKDPAVGKIPFKFKANPLPAGAIKDEKVVSIISLVQGYGKSTKQDYIIKKTADKRIEINLFNRQGAAFVEAPEQIVIENGLNLVNFIRADLNFDGKEDYMAHYLGEDKDGKYLAFKFYSDDMKPLWPNFQDVKVELDTKFKDMNTIKFTRFDHPTLGKMLVPTFFSRGLLPKYDQVKDFMGRYDTTDGTHLYYLEPLLTEKKFRVRSYTQTKWKEALKTSLKSKWYETVEVEQMLPISVNDAQEGKIRTLVSVGIGTQRQIMIVTFDSQKAAQGQILPQLVIQSENVDSLYSIRPNGLDVTGDVYLNVYDRSRVRIISTSGAGQNSDQLYEHDGETDIMVGHLASFEGPRGNVSIIQSREELISLSTVNGKTTKTTRPKLRYSFLSAKALSEMYSPVIYKRDGEQAAALYVDSTDVTGNRINLFEDQKGKLVSSIRNSLVIPANCKAIKPNFNPNTGSHEFIILCLEEKEWFIRTLPMN